MFSCQLQGSTKGDSQHPIIPALGIWRPLLAPVVNHTHMRTDLPIQVHIAKKQKANKHSLPVGVFLPDQFGGRGRRVTDADVEV